ncbi:MAG TPA: magnesium transporter, partial [Blastocatellia bacterium]|nr:magnesium transporter [Blastocatellia bacterium]
MSYPQKRLESGSAVPPGYSVNVVRKLLHRGARTNLARMFAKAYPVDAARTLAQLSEPERVRLFTILLADCDSAHAAAILSEMNSQEGFALLENLKPPQIAGLLSEMPTDDATSLASRLPEPLAAEVLALMEAQPAAGVRELLEHEAQTAGRIMTPDFFALEEEVTVSEAITALQRRSEDFEMVFYVYVVDKRNHLVGAVSLRRLLTTPPSTQLRRIMVTDVISARVDTDQEEVAKLVSQYNLLAIPVVDEEDRLVGIVTVDDVLDVVQEEATEDLLALAGVAAEERVTTKTGRSLRLRAPWLLVNLGTAFLAASVVEQFKDQIGAKPALAVLMPIVAGMGGNAATQTLTVIVRGIALGELTGVGRVFLRQSLVGIGNGLINGLVAAAIVGAFYNDVTLG